MFGLFRRNKSTEDGTKKYRLYYVDQNGNTKNVVVQSSDESQLNHDFRVQYPKLKIREVAFYVQE
jgi:hypothetical protein